MVSLGKMTKYLKNSSISVIILTMSENKYKEAWDYTMNELHDLYKSQNNERNS